MERNRGRQGSVIVLFVLAIVLFRIEAAWAQSAAPAEPAATKSVSATEVLATVASAVGSFFYIPFKAVAICPGMALASGASLAFTHGDRSTAEYLLRVGCTGTYVITPGMIRGQQEFQGSGER
jgi:hypothetical protein